MSKLSVYGGKGFVGGNFSRMYPDETIVIPREQREPESDWNWCYGPRTYSKY